MREYRLRPDRFAAVRKRLLLQLALRMGVLILCSLVLLFVEKPADLRFVLYVLPLLCLAMLIAGLLKLSRERRTWTAFRLRLRDDGILERALHPLPKIETKLSAITRIEEHPGAGLYIGSGPLHTRLFVHESLQDFAEFRISCDAHRPILVNRWARPLSQALALLFFALIPVACISKTPWLLIAATALMAVAIAAVFCLDRSMKTPAKQSVRRLWVYILLALGLAARLFFLLR